jgi:hypothetical protein
LPELRALQRLTAAAIMRPLGRGDRMQRRWIDGRPTRKVVSQFIKPNNRLTSLGRLELYNRQYWFRLIDCLWDDYPGLRAVLGQRRFGHLLRAYLEHFPSRSYSLRDLGEHMEEFLVRFPQWAGKRPELVREMARFEWAQVVAFDGAMRPPLAVDDVLGTDPARLRLGIQPYITLLELNYPLDDFSIAVKRQNLRNEASNAMEDIQRPGRPTRIALPRPQKVFLAVHRLDGSLYYKRLEEPAYRMLCALREGATLAEACENTGGGKGENWTQAVKNWFESWMRLGWFCKR